MSHRPQFPLNGILKPRNWRFESTSHTIHMGRAHLGAVDCMFMHFHAYGGILVL